MVTDWMTVARWLERLAENIEQHPGARNATPLLVAYASAAQKTGYGRDLIDRIWDVAARGEPYGNDAARALRAIVADARRQKTQISNPAEPSHG